MFLYILMFLLQNVLCGKNFTSGWQNSIFFFCHVGGEKKNMERRLPDIYSFRTCFMGPEVLKLSLKKKKKLCVQNSCVQYIV